MPRWFNTTGPCQPHKHYRVQAIIEPMLAGLPLQNVANDDIQFVIDLGLCRMRPEGGMAIANPIYRDFLVHQIG